MLERAGGQHHSHRLRYALTHWTGLALLLPLLLFLGLRLAVHVHIMNDPPADDFPSACPPEKLEGCDRVAMLAPHSNACVTSATCICYRRLFDLLRWSFHVCNVNRGMLQWSLTWRLVEWPRPAVMRRCSVSVRT